MSDNSYLNLSQCSHLFLGFARNLESRLLWSLYELNNRVCVTGIMWLERKAENSHLMPKFIMCRDLLLGYLGCELRHLNISAAILITACTTICPNYYSSPHKDCRDCHVDTEINHVMFLTWPKYNYCRDFTVSLILPQLMPERIFVMSQDHRRLIRVRNNICISFGVE